MWADTDIAAIERRSVVVRAVRAYFDGLGFTEVETPVRIAAPAPECHIDCPPVATGGFLRASPELQMKKLLAAGMEKIYQIGPCFRDGEKGSRHSPEFTMLEWYRRDATWMDIAVDLEGLLSSLGMDAPGAPDGGRRFRRLTVREAYRRHAGWDPWVAWDADRFDTDMALKIEPALAEAGGGVFLEGYPPQCASLAKVSDGAAERWEFYWDGMELANCFTELCDPDEQRRRFAEAREERARLGEADYPPDTGFIDCLPSIGGAAGVALGVDRLVMAVLGARDISRVRAAE